MLALVEVAIYSESDVKGRLSVLRSEFDKVDTCYDPKDPYGYAKERYEYRFEPCGYDPPMEHKRIVALLFEEHIRPLGVTRTDKNGTFKIPSPRAAGYLYAKSHQGYIWVEKIPPGVTEITLNNLNLNETAVGLAKRLEN